MEFLVIVYTEVELVYIWSYVVGIILNVNYQISFDKSRTYSFIQIVKERI